MLTKVCELGEPSDVLLCDFCSTSVEQDRVNRAKLHPLKDATRVDDVVDVLPKSSAKTALYGQRRV